VCRGRQEHRQGPERLAKRGNHIWQLDNLVQTTMSDMHIAPGTLHAVFVQS
jgi:hypothetical protein